MTLSLRCCGPPSGTGTAHRPHANCLFLRGNVLLARRAGRPSRPHRQRKKSISLC
ncbi:hypothetical protein DESPIGER_1487 [Desulfovibrio piger]|uniref:Uncharacterized protein n=1 Tax=Desulfovibrio piger TaxID=901 RepID=A0A1K1LF15_9BACT|nr:hypothetical protein DESPIGER_1487 [Desulfovibrio piger]